MSDTEETTWQQDAAKVLNNLANHEQEQRELASAPCSASDAAALETLRCDVCNCLLTSIERDEARDTGFQECRFCGFERNHKPKPNSQISGGTSAAS